MEKQVRSKSKLFEVYESLLRDSLSRFRIRVNPQTIIFFQREAPQDAEEGVP